MLNSKPSPTDKIRAAAILELRRRASIPKPLQTNFKPEPWQVKALADDAFIVLLSGSAGGGKSRTGLEMMHRYMQRHAGATGLMMRKAREWTGKSLVPFMKQGVIGRGGVGLYKKSDMQFQYPNGSVIYVGGMASDDQRESVRSIGGDGGLDIVLFEEANAFEENDLNEIIGRMRGKAGPYRQIILMTNPDSPNHWINRRLIVGGEASVHYSGAKDNPHNPPEYIDNLNRMTGILYERLVLGRWVQAEGVIYDNFTMDNVTAEAEYNPEWPVFWGVDDGYASGAGKGSESYHPRVFLLCQMTPQGGIHIFYEYIKTNELSEKSISNILDLPYRKAEVAYVDSSAQELLNRIRELPMSTIGATHKVSEGIKNVRRLICDGNGVRLLKVHPRCVETVNEFQSYRYDLASRSVEAGEPKPLKENDHCMDALRYVCHRLRYT